MKELLKKTYSYLPFKKELFSFLRIFNISPKIYKHLYFQGIFKVKCANSSFLIQHYGYQLENEIFWAGLTGGWERISMSLWIELCKNSNSIIDIGANTGVYSLVAKAVNSNASVFGFEPVERVCRKFEKNCELNNFNVKCFEYALSNYNGEATIYDTPSEHVYSVAVNKNISGLSDFVETKITTKTLSSFIKENSIESIDLMKIDVETHEPEVLEGMGVFLKLYQPTLLIEILNDDVGQKVQSLLSDLDYLYFNIDEINTPKQVYKIEKSDYYNYLICKAEVAKKLKLI